MNALNQKMSIATKHGDGGTTGLMYNRRVSKSHPRVEACGCVDEINAAIGLAKSNGTHDFILENLQAIQKDLVTLMGELATALEDLPRYIEDGFLLVVPAMTARLDGLVKRSESETVLFKGWATPGATAHSAALDVARTICRRAERRVCVLHESKQLNNPEILIFLNRLSDVLWLFARWAETQEGIEKKD